MRSPRRDAEHRERALHDPRCALAQPRGRGGQDDVAQRQLEPAGHGAHVGALGCGPGQGGDASPGVTVEGVRRRRVGRGEGGLERGEERLVHTLGVRQDHLHGGPLQLQTLGASLEQLCVGGQSHEGHVQGLLLLQPNLEHQLAHRPRREGGQGLGWVLRRAKLHEGLEGEVVRHRGPRVHLDLFFFGRRRLFGRGRGRHLASGLRGLLRLAGQPGPGQHHDPSGSSHGPRIRDRAARIGRKARPCASRSRSHQPARTSDRCRRT